MNESVSLSAALPPVAHNVQEWRGFLERDFHLSNETLERIQAEKNALKRREALLLAIKEANPSLNGQADAVAKRMAINHEQLNAKEQFLSGSDREQLSDESLEAATSGSEKSVEQSPSMLVQGARYIWRKTFREHPYLTIGALAALGWYYLVPAGLSLGTVPAFLERLAAQVPHGKMKQLVESMKLLQRSTVPLDAGVSLAPPDVAGML